MPSGLSTARQARAQHRHELRTLTYVTLDQANGGVVRNLTHEGIAVQAVAAVRPGQQLRVRFELRGPRLRVESHGEVMWATPSGQCGIRFLDGSPRMTRQINEWIFGNLLAGLPPWSGPDGSVFAKSRSAQSKFLTRSLALVAPGKEEEYEDDGLLISAAPVKVIELRLRPEPDRIRDDAAERSAHVAATPPATELDWLSQPLSGRGLVWTVNTLVVLAALLLFALVFLSVTGEPPRRPFAITVGTAVLVAALYWGFFKVFGGGSPGARLARLRELGAEDDEETRGPRFR
jgi:hypothetical protein